MTLACTGLLMLTLLAPTVPANGQASSPAEAVRAALAPMLGDDVVVPGAVYSGLPEPSPGIVFVARALKGGASRSSDQPRVSVEIQALSRGRVIARRVYLFPIESERFIVVPTRTVEPGELIAQGDLQLQKKTGLPTSEKWAGSLDTVVGRIATHRLPAGEAIPLRHVQAEEIVRRGDRVMVRALVGGLHISMEGKASDDGALGDWVRIVNPSSGQVIRARVVERGVAEVKL